MSSIKVKYRPSTVEGRPGTVYYQIIHGRKIRQLQTDFRVNREEWDERKSMVIIDKPGERMMQLQSIRNHIRSDVERLNKIVKRLEGAVIDYTVDDVIEEFKRYDEDFSLFNYMDNLIIKLKNNFKLRTSETYRTALNSFKKFRRGEDITLDCLTSDIMEAYEAWHRSRGNTPNTISFYTRILRAVYNRALEEKVIEDRNPFKRVYTGVDKTLKRAIPLEAIRRMKYLDLSMYEQLDFARDMFMMSFYLRGISFIDLSFLKKKDLRNGCITYRRRKTNQLMNIEWTKEMQQILDKYGENPTDYLMPIITKRDGNERNAYRNAGYNINYNLKKLAGVIGVSIPLTLYVARHSWASAAKMKGIPVSVISEGMGHDSEATTNIYLASLETSVVDKANSLIIKSL